MCRIKHRKLAIMSVKTFNKRLVVLVSIGFIACALYVATNMEKRQPTKPPMPKSQNRVHLATDLPEKSKDGDGVIPPKILSPLKAEPSHDPAEFNGATADPATMQVLSKYKNWSDVGEVRVTERKTQQLWLGDRMIFEADFINPVRTMSKNGMIALSAVISGEYSAPAPTEEKPSASDLPSSIWIVDVESHAKRVSPPMIKAAAPLISPDGDAVAFRSIQIGGSGVPQMAQLMIVNLRTNQYRVFRGSEALDDYKVWPVEWSDGGKTLKVIEDHGETGGHMVMRQIRLE
jgi:hypothetical protein